MSRTWLPEYHPHFASIYPLIQRTPRGIRYGSAFGFNIHRFLDWKTFSAVFQVCKASCFVVLALETPKRCCPPLRSATGISYSLQCTSPEGPRSGEDNQGSFVGKNNGMKGFFKEQRSGGRGRGSWESPPSQAMSTGVVTGSAAHARRSELACVAKPGTFTHAWVPPSPLSSQPSPNSLAGLFLVEKGVPGRHVHATTLFTSWSFTKQTQLRGASLSTLRCCKAGPNPQGSPFPGLSFALLHPVLLLFSLVSFLMHFLFCTIHY